MLTQMQDIICETQGDIFRCANEMKYDMESFVPAYMTSEFCKRHMDGIYSYFQMADGEECLDYITNEINVPKLNKVIYPSSIMAWIGFTYRQLAIELKKPSCEIIKKVPFYSMVAYYPGLHTIDEEMSIEIITENKFPEVSYG